VSGRKRRPWRVVAAIGAAITMIACWGCRVLVQPTTIRTTAAIPADFPADGFSHAAFESLLRQYVRADGDVDYEAWKADARSLARLDGYLAAVAAYSPDNAPERFPSEPDRFVYWVHAYNALVIRAVLEHWPIESVTDVKAPIELVQGLGFFYGQEFVVGGQTYNLYDLERDRILTSTTDARIHFVLNCASGSCPVIPPELPSGDALEPFLAQAARDFVADRDNVHVDHAGRRLEVSTIFEWYEDDFLADLRLHGRPADRGIVDYLISVAPEEQRVDLERAAEGEYEVVFREYDWSINAAGQGE
jgi:hypothetical protein